MNYANKSLKLCFKIQKLIAADKPVNENAKSKLRNCKTEIETIGRIQCLRFSLKFSIHRHEPASDWWFYTSLVVWLLKCLKFFKRSRFVFCCITRFEFMARRFQLFLFVWPFRDFNWRWSKFCDHNAAFQMKITRIGTSAVHSCLVYETKSLAWLILMEETLEEIIELITKAKINTYGP